MKEVVAIIRMNMMNKTKRALAAAGIGSMTVRKVMGRGKGKVDYLLLKGAQEGYEEAISQIGPGPKMLPKRLISIVLTEDRVQTAVQTLIETNQSGSPGDGKIFVLPVNDAVRVRTGETGETAVDDEVPAAKS